MSELYNLVVECKKAVTRLDIYIEHNSIKLPIAFSLAEMREWFLIMQGYAECLQNHCSIMEGE